MSNERKKFSDDFQKAYDELLNGTYKILEEFCKSIGLDLHVDDTAEIVQFFQVDVMRRVYNDPNVIRKVSE